MSDSFSHINQKGDPKMVNVSAKQETIRVAKAESIVLLGKDIMKEIRELHFQTKKGSITQTAIIAATMAVKNTSNLIPLCHPLSIQGCDIEINPHDDHFHIYCTVTTQGKTGVEMEALTGASVAALTIYDMTKALSHDITIDKTRLVKKTGGKSDYERT